MRDYKSLKSAIKYPITNFITVSSKSVQPSDDHEAIGTPLRVQVWITRQRLEPASLSVGRYSDSLVVTGVLDRSVKSTAN